MKKRVNAGKLIRLLSYILVVAVSISLTLVFADKRDKAAAADAKAAGTGAQAGAKAAGTGAQAEAGAGSAGGREGDGPAAAEGQPKDITFVDNWYMDTRVKFIMDGVSEGMGNMGEILDTVKNIRHTSELSWFREWDKTAERVKAYGDQSLKAGHKTSAGEAYLRAANYYLGAEVFLHTNPDDPRIPETYKKGADSFIQGLQLIGEPVELVSIPYEGTTLRGYFFKAPGNGRAPTLLVHEGFDAPMESCKYIGDAAVKRGYNCLLFEGPGQGLSIREQKLTFRPDWENVVSPVVDYVLSRQDVDPDNVMLMGLSMGGGFAVRAAAFEKRLKVCIADPGYVNLYDMVSDMFGSKYTNLYEQDPAEFNKDFLELAKYDVGLRWGINHGMWVFGGKTPSDFLTLLKQYDYTNVIDKIQCTMLVMDGTKETWGKGQAKKLYDMLKCPKDYMLFTDETSAAYHCQTGAPAVQTQRLFDWLDEHVRDVPHQEAGL